MQDTTDTGGTGAEFSVTVVGRDRPGIIAELAAALTGVGANLTDSTMTLLHGHFAMMLICTGGAGVDSAEAALAPLAAEGELVVAVRELAQEAPEPIGRPYILTVHGADRLGIVAAVTRAVADAGGNITDLTTRLVGDLYLLVAEVDVPATTDVGALTDALADIGDETGFDVTLREAQADLL
jgi:glycine cleavage system transcriptional repressor